MTTLATNFLLELVTYDPLGKVLYITEIISEDTNGYVYKHHEYRHYTTPFTWTVVGSTNPALIDEPEAQS